jgi:hypothetical protein
MCRSCDRRWELSDGLSIRGGCNADIGCGAKTLRCPTVRECSLGTFRRVVCNRALCEGVWETFELPTWKVQPSERG